jgi:hypothetical protein
MLQDVSSNRLIFVDSILHIRATVKGKPAERRGRKATGLRVAGSDHDSGVTRMYNTNNSVLRPPLAKEQQHWLGVVQHDAIGTFCRVIFARRRG